MSNAVRVSSNVAKYTAYTYFAHLVHSLILIAGQCKKSKLFWMVSLRENWQIKRREKSNATAYHKNKNVHAIQCKYGRRLLVSQRCDRVVGKRFPATLTVFQYNDEGDGLMCLEFYFISYTLLLSAENACKKREKKANVALGWASALPVLLDSVLDLERNIDMAGKANARQAISPSKFQLR